MGNKYTTILPLSQNPPSAFEGVGSTPRTTSPDCAGTSTLSRSATPQTATLSSFSAHVRSASRGGGESHAPPSSLGRLVVGPVDFLLVDDALLEELEINTVVSALPQAPRGMNEVLTRNGIDPRTDYRVYPLEDSAEHYISLFEHPNIFETTQYIHEKRLAGKNVLVHCDGGITRSPSVIMAYLLIHGTGESPGEHMSFDCAYETIYSRRERLEVGIFNEELRELERSVQTDGLNRLESTLPYMTRARQLMLGGFSPGIRSVPSGGSLQMSIQTDEREAMLTSPCVDPLDLMRKRWGEVRRRVGGHTQMAIVFHEKWLQLAGDRLRTLLRPVSNVERMMLTSLRVVHQLMWGGLSEVRVAQLIRFHAHIGLTVEDIHIYRDALKDMFVHFGVDRAEAAMWDQFFVDLWSAWNTIEQEQQAEDDAEANNNNNTVAEPYGTPGMSFAPLRACGSGNQCCTSNGQQSVASAPVSREDNTAVTSAQRRSSNENGTPLMTFVLPPQAGRRRDRTNSKSTSTSTTTQCSVRSPLFHGTTPGGGARTPAAAAPCGGMPSGHRRLGSLEEELDHADNMYNNTMTTPTTNNNNNNNNNDRQKTSAANFHSPVLMSGSGGASVSWGGGGPAVVMGDEDSTPTTTTT
eukprot:PhM_4_TR5166/c3_g1_i1/m.79851